MAIEVISTLKPKNNGSFPIAEAADVSVDENGKRLNEKLAETDEALGSYIDDVDSLLGDGTTPDGGSSSNAYGLKVKTFATLLAAAKFIITNGVMPIRAECKGTISLNNDSTTVSDPSFLCERHSYSCAFLFSNILTEVYIYYVSEDGAIRFDNAVTRDNGNLNNLSTISSDNLNIVKVYYFNEPSEVI